MGDEGVEQSAKDWLLDQIGSEITEAALEKTPWWIERMMDYADHVATSIREQVTRLKDSLEILGGRADLEKMRADIAEEKVARLQVVVNECQTIITKQHRERDGLEISLILSREQVARLEKERDGMRDSLQISIADIDTLVTIAACHVIGPVLEKIQEAKVAAEARIQELEGGKK